VVTQAKGKSIAVLHAGRRAVQNVTGRTQGPGLLCRAMGIDGRLNGHDLLSRDFYIADDGAEVDSIVKRPRFGVDYAGHWAKRLLRFYIRGNPNVSRL
jgi:DNA-3-methyladenine glycosylase